MVQTQKTFLVHRFHRSFTLHNCEQHSFANTNHGPKADKTGQPHSEARAASSL
jgi:hypothetical protein